MVEQSFFFVRLSKNLHKPDENVKHIQVHRYRFIYGIEVFLRLSVVDARLDIEDGCHAKNSQATV
jgi:hypothetical protein